MGNLRPTSPLRDPVIRDTAAWEGHWGAPWNHHRSGQASRSPNGDRTRPNGTGRAARVIIRSRPTGPTNAAVAETRSASNAGGASSGEQPGRPRVARVPTAKDRRTGSAAGQRGIPHPPARPSIPGGPHTRCSSQPEGLLPADQSNASTRRIARERISRRNRIGESPAAYHPQLGVPAHPLLARPPSFPYHIGLE